MKSDITPPDEMSCLVGHNEMRNRLLNLEWWNEEAASDVFEQTDSYEAFARYAYQKIKQANADDVTKMEKACIKGYPETKRRLLALDRWSTDSDDTLNVSDLFGGSFGFIDFTICVVDELKRGETNTSTDTDTSEETDGESTND